MTTRTLCLLMATSTLLMTACGRDKVELPPPSTRDLAAASAPFTTPSVDPSLPTAPAVLQGKANAPGDTASGARTPGAPAGEKNSAWVPMAGQNNDHSAPLLPASAASAR